MLRLALVFPIVGVAMAYPASASEDRAPRPPPVDTFSVRPHHGPMARAETSAAADPGRGADRAEVPDLGPVRPTPPGPVFRPDAEPISIQPAASAIGTLRESDNTFAVRVSYANNAEIALAKLALRRASQSDLREFAQHVLNDHMAANNDLHTLLEARNIPLPSGIDKDHQAVRAKLSKMSGTHFDREYVRVQLMDHVTTTALFREEAASGSDSWLRSWAGRMLPVMQEHVQALRELHEALKPGV